MQGITAVLLSLRKKPVIRYEKMSPMAKKLGIEIQVSAVRILFNCKIQVYSFSIAYNQNHLYLTSASLKYRHCYLF